MAERFIKNEEMFSLPALEHALVMYVTSDARETFSKSFDIAKIPVSWIRATHIIAMVVDAN